MGIDITVIGDCDWLNSFLLHTKMGFTIVTNSFKQPTKTGSQRWYFSDGIEHNHVDHGSRGLALRFDEKTGKTYGKCLGCGKEIEMVTEKPKAFINSKKSQ